jgi:L-ascorbate metabolism protein UlaG (beta-lactamase superfamily)
MARLTWHGHSTFTLETDAGKRIMFDPFLDDNPKSDIRAEDVVDLDYILCSHGHFDHFGDAIEMAKRTGATWWARSSWFRSRSRRVSRTATA